MSILGAGWGGVEWGTRFAPSVFTYIVSSDIIVLFILLDGS
jgi:hypothetical protein